MPTANYPIQCQTTGIKRWICTCGVLNESRFRAGRYRVRCRECRRVWIVGDAFYSADSHDAHSRRPADLAIADSSRPDIEDALPGDEAFPHAILAGIWRSGDPVTLEIPELDDRSALYTPIGRDGPIWIARQFASGSRYLVITLEAFEDGRDERSVVGAREWLKSMRRVS